MFYYDISCIKVFNTVYIFNGGFIMFKNDIVNSILGSKNTLKCFTKKISAFTLAEVLITLGVIGVVAALTRPMLIQNFQTDGWQIKDDYPW